MKIKLLFLALVFSLGTNSLIAQDQIFSKFSDDKNISSITISKAFLSFVPDVDLGSFNSTKLLEKVDNIEVYKSDNKKASKKMKKEAAKIKKDKAYKILMNTKKNGDEISFFMKEGYNGTLSDIILPLGDDSQYTIIRMTGPFTMEDVMNALNTK